MTEKAYCNIRLVKSFYDAVSRGNWGSARTVLEPNVEWIEPTLPGLWFGGTHRGADAVFNEVIRPAAEKLEKFRLKVRKFFALGDYVIALGRFRGRNKFTGQELDAETAHIWTIRFGKAVRFEGLHDYVGWEEALGLPRPELEEIVDSGMTLTKDLAWL